MQYLSCDYVVAVVFKLICSCFCLDPKFSSASVENIAGKLNVTWGFRHTGGAPLTRVMVSCVSTDEIVSDDRGLTGTIYYTSNSLCGDVSVDGMLSLPSGSDYVTAGTNYSCTVTATNSLGCTTTHTTNYILVLQGWFSINVNVTSLYSSSVFRHSLNTNENNGGLISTTQSHIDGIFIFR